MSDHGLRGAELARMFHTEAVGPLLARKLPWLRYAAGRLGSGSDVLGLDDATSRDHDWGCRLTPLDVQRDRGQPAPDGAVIPFWDRPYRAINLAMPAGLLADITDADVARLAPWHRLGRAVVRQRRRPVQPWSQVCPPNRLPGLDRQRLGSGRCRGGRT
jgi:hypothetical protein